MGLHQAHSTPESIRPEEAQERYKVFRSLYLRDKSCSISRGSICWLPSWDCSLIPELCEGGSGDNKYAVRFQLTRLEDETYRLFHSPDLLRQSYSKYMSAILRIDQGLGHWANENDVFSASHKSPRDVDLLLEFLSARICVLRKSPQPDHINQVLNDSRASCLLIIVSCGKHDASTIDQLDHLLSSKRPSKTLAKKASGRSRKNSKASSSSLYYDDTSDSPMLRSNSLLDTFSVPAFFLLAKNVIRPSSTTEESVEADLDLLRRTCACFKEHDAKAQAKNHTCKIYRSFERVLEVISLMRKTESPEFPPVGEQQSSVGPNLSSIGQSVNQQHQTSGFDSFTNPSTSAIAPISWENFMNRSTPRTIPGSPSDNASPALHTPMDSQPQSYDPRRQNPAFPQMQEQFMRPPTFSNQPTNEFDVAMDDFADSRLLSDFLATRPGMMY